MCGNRVCASSGGAWRSAECIFPRSRASAHQHKALNIYADLQRLTAPSPSVTPIISSPSASYHLIPSSCSPLLTCTYLDTSALFWLIMRARLGETREIGGLEGERGVVGSALVKIRGAPDKWQIWFSLYAHPSINDSTSVKQGKIAFMTCFYFEEKKRALATSGINCLVFASSKNFQLVFLYLIILGFREEFFVKWRSKYSFQGSSLLMRIVSGKDPVMGVLLLLQSSFAFV